MHQTKEIAICKECEREERANGSSRCEKCSARHKSYLLSQERLRRKVEAQAKN